MAKQDFTAGQVLTAAQMDSLQANDYNWTVSTKTDSYTLVATDAGTRVVMNAATAKTITVNTGIFAAGDTVWIHNINTGTCTVTAGTATVNTAGSLALAQWEGGALYFTSASSAIFFRGAGTSYGVATGGTSSSITVGGVNYTLLTFTSGGTLTVTKAGLFDVLLVGGGGGGGWYASNDGKGGGAGAGGLIVIPGVYLSANQTITIGAGGASATNGNNTTFGSLLGAVGGGQGGGTNSPAQYFGSAGGSGGGSLGGRAGGSGTVLQGNAGNTSPLTNPGAGGGGGGFSSVAGAGSGGTGGNGGTGYDVSAFIGGSAAYIAAGGAGGGQTTGGIAGNSTGGDGGSGTGNGSNATSTAYGSGAGGGHSAGGTGANGVVYVRFKV